MSPARTQAAPGSGELVAADASPRAAAPDDAAACREARGLRSQFAAPRGVLGRLAGLVMARKNGPMNAACVELLAPAPGERVLEIGFGPGRSLARLAARVGATGLVVGVDPSEAMQRQASRLNRAALRAGRMRLVRGRAEVLPEPGPAFDAALAVNCIQLWDDRPAGLAELRRVLRPGGRLLLGLRLHEEDLPFGGRFASPGFREETVAAVEADLRAAGFGELQQVRRRAGRAFVALIARAPAQVRAARAGGEAASGRSSRP